MGVGGYRSREVGVGGYRRREVGVEMEGGVEKIGEKGRKREGRGGKKRGGDGMGGRGQWTEIRMSESERQYTHTVHRKTMESYAQLHSGTRQESQMNYNV